MACRDSADECRGDDFCGSSTIRKSANIICSAACNDGRAVASPLCCKCKERPAEAKANQTEDLCGGCLRSSLFAKFKLAVTSHSMINPSDNILVAFSGGPASREENPSRERTILRTAEMIRRTKCNGTAGQSWLRKQIEDCLLLQDSDEEHE